jgi:hypothetical protein
MMKEKDVVGETKMGRTMELSKEMEKRETCTHRYTVAEGR